MLEPQKNTGNVVTMALVRQRDMDKVLMAVVGMRIERARRAADLDIEGLAHLSHTKYGAVFAYEKGARIPNVFTGLRMAKVLKVDAEDLFTKPATKAELDELAKRRKQAAA